MSARSLLLPSSRTIIIRVVVRRRRCCTCSGGLCHGGQYVFLSQAVVQLPVRQATRGKGEPTHLANLLLNRLVLCLHIYGSGFTQIR